MFGEGDNQVAIIYTKEAAILLRDRVLDEWCKKGQLVKYFDLSIAIKTEDMVIISMYMPVYTGNNDIEIEQVRSEVQELTSGLTRTIF